MIVIRPLAGRAANKNIIQRPGAGGCYQGEFGGRRQPTASPMLTAIMSGGVEISGRELYKYR